MRKEDLFVVCLYGSGTIRLLELICVAWLSLVNFIKLLFNKLKQLFKKLKQICLRNLNRCLINLNSCLIKLTELKQDSFSNIFNVAAIN